MKPSKHPLPKLVALSELFDADQLAYEEKLQRDRAIAIASKATTPDARLNAWINKQSSEETNQRAERWLFSWHIVQLVLCVLGLLAGGGLSTLVMQYDGSEPINIISSWIILAGLPFLLMFFWLLTLLPLRIPIIPLLSEVLQSAIFQPLGQRLFTLLHKPSVQANPKTPRFTPSKNLLFAMTNSLMQWFALGLGIGSLLMAMYLLASSDLAFAWSTSLGVTDTQLYSITSLISAPFASLSNHASPALELIQNSHYFRLDESASQQFTANDAASQLAQWWPFIILSIAFYAILPRIMTLFIASYRLEKTVLSEIQSLPEFAGLMNRMSTPLVTSTHSTAQSETPIAQSTIEFEPTQFSLSAPLIYWNQIEVPKDKLTKALKNRGLKIDNTYEAGGQHSTRHDQAIIEQIVKAKQQNAMVLVKAWDAPISEMTDWLEQLCKHLQGAIIVLLIDPDHTRQARHETLVDWQNVYHDLHESGLHVELLEL